MNTLDFSQVFNLLGFAVGVALYAILAAMVWQRAPIFRFFNKIEPDELCPTCSSKDWRLPAMAILGLMWNASGLTAVVFRAFEISYPFYLVVFAYIALGFLPALVAHYALQPEPDNQISKLSFRPVAGAYAVSLTAAFFQLYAAFWQSKIPSETALQILGFGTLTLSIALLVAKSAQPLKRRLFWAIALGLFAFSAFHGAQNAGHEFSGWRIIELIGHHTSLALVLAILYQDYRFAFADLFLKQLLTISAVSAIALISYIWLIVPMLAANRGSINSPLTFVVAVALWVITAFLFPYLQKGVNCLVDKVLLRRADYSELQSEIAQDLTAHESPHLVLDAVCEKITPALSARDVFWHEVGAIVREEEPLEITENNIGEHKHNHLKHNVNYSQKFDFTGEIVTTLTRNEINSAKVFVPTSEPPFYEITIGEMHGGRRIFSDDIEMLENVALTTARRIDALRVTHERCEQEIREQAIGKMASEAQLQALRAQINPHFLFNALTTIGYLIQTSPNLALETLLKLTKLLRGVLRSSGEFVALDEELKIIESYLEIEKMRFEERLDYKIEIPPELKPIRVPAFLLQPLVENAVKHGIAPLKNGGKVTISIDVDEDEEQLLLEVTDTGAGVSEFELARRKKLRVGLSNIEERLKTYFGKAAKLKIESTVGKGTSATVSLPVKISPNGNIEIPGETNLIKAA